MERFKNIAIGVAALAVFAFFATLTGFAWVGYIHRQDAATALFARVDPVIGSALHALNGDPRSATAEGKLPIREAVLGQVTHLRHEVMGQITHLRRDVLEGPTSVAGLLNTQLTAIQGTVLTLGDKVDPALAGLTKLEGSANAAMVPVLNIAKDASEQADLLGQCEFYDDAGNVVGGNVDCFANRVIPMMKSVEKMADAGANAAPKITAEVVEMGGSAQGTMESVQSIAKAAKRAVDDAMKPKTLWQQVKTYMLFGATIVGKIL